MPDTVARGLAEATLSLKAGLAPPPWAWSGRMYNRMTDPPCPRQMISWHGDDYGADSEIRDSGWASNNDCIGYPHVDRYVSER